MSKEDPGASSAEANPAESEISMSRGPRPRSFSGGGGGGGSGGAGGAGGTGGSSGTSGGSNLRPVRSPREDDAIDRATNSNSAHRKLLSDPRFRIRPLQQVISACTGAMITACFMTPLDVIKTRMQSQQSPAHKCFFYSNGLMDHLFASGPNGPELASLRPRPQFSSSWDALMKISRHEGVAALWSGLGPTLVSALPSTIIYFVAYEQFKARYLQLYERHYSNTLEPRQLENWLKTVPYLQGYQENSTVGGTHDVRGDCPHLCSYGGESYRAGENQDASPAADLRTDAAVRPECGGSAGGLGLMAGPAAHDPQGRSFFGDLLAHLRKPEAESWPELTALVQSQFPGRCAGGNSGGHCDHSVRRGQDARAD
ncbi:uncharacterized protein LOC120453981 isoform X2 [Drosophila santomea]|uniref:uncharacterized protein LOC120453981 isoform X2 n=1 Tax=Drosophila santomea TaxID=129105 RepID=UPI001954F4E7|nr:uncharacterized protein LOC120453981 isoform X2 [Drosophila santomea]